MMKIIPKSKNRASCLMVDFSGRFTIKNELVRRGMRPRLTYSTRTRVCIVSVAVSFLVLNIHWVSSRTCAAIQQTHLYLWQHTTIIIAPPATFYLRYHYWDVYDSGLCLNTVLLHFYSRKYFINNINVSTFGKLLRTKCVRFHRLENFRTLNYVYSFYSRNFTTDYVCSTTTH